MSAYKIDKERLDNFVAERRAIQYIFIVVLGIGFVKILSRFGYIVETKSNIIWYVIIFVFFITMIVVVVCLLIKFNTVIKIYISWDENTELIFNDKKITIKKEGFSNTYNFNELTIVMHKFYGWHINPLYGLGYSTLIFPDGKTLNISSIVFDFRYGSNKIANMLRSKVLRYSEETLSWFVRLPSKEPFTPKGNSKVL